MIASPTPLRRSRLLELIGTNRFAKGLRILGIVGSTSDLAIAEFRRGAKDSLAIFAEGQLRGHGRRGARWASPSRAGIYLSVLARLRNLSHSPLLLAALAGVAAAEGVDASLGGVIHHARIKWPNDIVVDRRKVGGVIVDLLTDGAGAPAVVIGIGINANTPPDALPMDGVLPAGSLSALTGSIIDREILAAALLGALDRRLAELETGVIDPMIETYRTREILRGAQAMVEDGSRIHEGVVLLADPLDGIHLRDAEGCVTVIRPEHAHIRAVRFPATSAPHH